MRLSTLKPGLCALMLACSPVPDAPATPPPAPVDLGSLPGASVYNLKADLIDQDGKTVPLSVFAGQPVLISMFYASCPSACPMLVADVQAIESRLTPEQLANLRVLLVSLDPQSDTPAALTAAVERYEIDATRWRLTSPTVDGVRSIAAVLGISYQAVEGGEMHHSSIITLLDGQGEPQARLDGLRQDPQPLVDALARL